MIQTVRFWLLGVRIRVALRLLPRVLREPSIRCWRDETEAQAQLAVFAAAAEAVAEYQRRAEHGAVNN